MKNTFIYDIVAIIIMLLVLIFVSSLLGKPKLTVTVLPGDGKVALDDFAKVQNEEQFRSFIKLWGHGWKEDPNDDN